MKLIHKACIKLFYIQNISWEHIWQRTTKHQANNKLKGGHWHSYKNGVQFTSLNHYGSFKMK